MHEIQLLPKRYLTAEPTSRYLRWALGAGRVIILFTLAIVLAVFFSRFKLDSDRVNLEREVYYQLQQISLDQDFEKDFRRVQERLKRTEFVLDKLFYPDPYLAAVLASVPSQGVSFTRLEITPQQLTIEGTAADYSLVSAFWEKLRSLPGYEDLDLVGLGRKSEGNNPGAEGAQDEGAESKVVFVLQGELGSKDQQ